jgi:hypothetical protein
MPGDFEYSNDYVNALIAAGAPAQIVPTHIKRAILQLGQAVGLGATNTKITAVANAATITPNTGTLYSVTNNSAATLTITIATSAVFPAISSSGPPDGQEIQVRIYDFSAAAQTITWVNTENSSVSAPTTSNGSTTSPRTVWFQYNAATSEWRCTQNV